MYKRQVRKRFDAKEIQLFKDVLREGVEKGVFQVDDIDMTAELVSIGDRDARTYP